jgi:hypothetical protein
MLRHAISRNVCFLTREGNTKSLSEYLEHGQKLIKKSALRQTFDSQVVSLAYLFDMEVTDAGATTVTGLRES